MDTTWLRADAGVPFDVPRVYRREVAGKDHLATLSIQKRPRGEVDIVEATGWSARKKIKYV